jgi:hypothetical protein
MAQVCLLIIYQRILRAAVFWLLHMPWVAGWLRLIPQADSKGKKFFNLPLKGVNRFSLYVDAEVLRVPQDGTRSRFCFVFALFFFACYDVAEGFFSTRPTWLHAEAASVWMWRNATPVFFCTRKQRTAMIAQCNRALAWPKRIRAPPTKQAAADPYKQFWR